MYFLRGNNGKYFYLRNNNNYMVGRKQTDILILDDKSISRKHAIIGIKNNVVTLMDCGAKYNTFVNGNKLEPQVEKVLNVGDEIKFGVYESIFSLESFTLKVLIAKLNQDGFKKIELNVTYLEGELVQEWSDKITHITTEQIILTVKTLCAIVAGQTIVTSEFWDACIKHVKENKSLPDPKDFKPPLHESMLSKNINLEYNPNRKTLFKDKIFLFYKNKDKRGVDVIINLVGGKSIFWGEKPIKIGEIDKNINKYLVFQTNEPLKNSNYEDVSKLLIMKGKRTIPLHEIALAIVKCSCEKDCNPDFDRTGNLLKNNDANYKGEILATETQSQLLKFNNSQVNTDCDLPLSESLQCFNDKKELSCEEGNSNKREGETLANVKVKKIKSDECFQFNAKEQKVDKEENLKTERDTFSFASGSITTGNLSNNKKYKGNPFFDFLKKRKLDCETELSSKKSKLYSEDRTEKEKNETNSPMLISNVNYPSLKENKNLSSSDSPKIPKENIFCSTFKSNISTNKPDINHMPEINKIKEDLSKAIEAIKTEPTDVYESIDLSNCITIVYLEEFTKKVDSASLNSTKFLDTTDNRKQFKKFKKVPALHIQTKIISHEDMETVICGSSGVSRVEFDAEEGM